MTYPKPKPKPHLSPRETHGELLHRLQQADKELQYLQHVYQVVARRVAQGANIPNQSTFLNGLLGTISKIRSIIAGERPPQ